MTRAPLLGWAFVVAASFTAAAQPAPQPEVVCDFPAVTVGTLEAGALRTREEGPLRLTFRDLDAEAGKARMTFGYGASGDEFAALTVEKNAISYLVERAGVFKMVVTTATKAAGRERLSRAPGRVTGTGTHPWGERHPLTVSESPAASLDLGERRSHPCLPDSRG